MLLGQPRDSMTIQDQELGRPHIIKNSAEGPTLLSLLPVLSPHCSQCLGQPLCSERWPALSKDISGCKTEEDLPPPTLATSPLRTGIQDNVSCVSQLFQPLPISTFQFQKYFHFEVFAIVEPLQFGHGMSFKDCCVEASVPSWWCD